MILRDYGRNTQGKLTGRKAYCVGRKYHRQDVCID